MKFKPIPLIAYLCILPVLVELGIWQLNRADEKRVAHMLQDRGQKTETLLLSEQIRSDLQSLLYRNIKSTGHFDGVHQYLLDNQISQGKAGYFVLTPFLIKGEKKAVLVNRGWLPVGKTRNDIPEISVGNEERSINGRINHFPSVGIKLEGAEIPTKTWPALVQVVDTKVISKRLGYQLMPFQVELDKDAAYGYKREWHSASPMPPAKHIAYAVQWFLLAITLTILFVKYGRQNNHDKP
jgi:surfeit locus 1 family protein